MQELIDFLIEYFNPPAGFLQLIDGIGRPSQLVGNQFNDLLISSGEVKLFA